MEIKLSKSSLQSAKRKLRSEGFAIVPSRLGVVVITHGLEDGSLPFVSQATAKAASLVVCCHPAQVAEKNQVKTCGSWQGETIIHWGCDSITWNQAPSC